MGPDKGGLGLDMTAADCACPGWACARLVRLIAASSWGQPQPVGQATSDVLAGYPGRPADSQSKSVVESVLTSVAAGAGGPTPTPASPLADPHPSWAQQAQKDVPRGFFIQNRPRRSLTWRGLSVCFESMRPVCPVALGRRPACRSVRLPGTAWSHPGRCRSSS